MAGAERPGHEVRLNGRMLILVALGATTALAWLPLITVLASSVLAEALGCELNEGNVHPCPVVGIDLGSLLYEGFVLGWLALVTWPLMLLTLLAWLCLAALVILRWLRASAATRASVDT